MISFLLRFKVLLFLLRFVFVPLLAFSLALFVIALMLWSVYILAVVKTASRVGENPYLYVPLLVLEILAFIYIAYIVVVYINKVRKSIQNRRLSNEEAHHRPNSWLRLLILM